MIKYTILTLFLIMSVGVSAQKIKTKKDIILVDDKEVAQIEKREDKKTKEKTIVFYDMNRQDSVSFRQYKLAPQEIYYGITTSLVADTADMKLEVLSFTFNEEKALTELLVKQYNFITSAGFQSQTIKNYIVNQTEKIIPNALIEIAQAKEKNAQIDAMKLVVTPTWDVTRDGKGIAKIVNATIKFPPQNFEPIVFVDNSGNEFARISSWDGKKTIVSTFNSRNLEIDTRSSFSMESFRPDYLLEIVRLLAKEEYLPNQALSFDVTKAEEAKQNMLAAASMLPEIKARTIVYGELGLKGHQPLFGFFKCQFRQTEDGNMNSFKESSVFDEDNYRGYQITYYTEPSRASNLDLNEVDFTSGRIIPISECSYFAIKAVYDKEGNQTMVNEAYSPTEFRPVYNGSGILGKIQGDRQLRFAMILTPPNYSGLTKYGDMYILSRVVNQKDKKYKSIARNYFTKKDLADFVKGYSAMEAKVEANGAEYLSGEEGLKKFAADFDTVIMEHYRDNDLIQ